MDQAVTVGNVVWVVGIGVAAIVVLGLLLALLAAYAKGFEH